MDSSAFQAIPMATFNTASLTGSYAAANGTGFADDIKILRIYNASDKDVTVSYDGVTDHDVYPTKYGFTIDLQSNHACTSSFGGGTLNGRKGQIIYVKGTAGTGNLYIVGYR